MCEGLDFVYISHLLTKARPVYDGVHVKKLGAFVVYMKEFVVEVCYCDGVVTSQSVRSPTQILVDNIVGMIDWEEAKFHNIKHSTYYKVLNERKHLLILILFVTIIDLEKYSAREFFYLIMQTTVECLNYMI